MTIAYVEDEALKTVVLQILKAVQITNVSVSKPNTGGWSEVIKSVKNLINQNISAVGIIDGDVKRDAEDYMNSNHLNNLKIFILQKREIEKYFYDKELWNGIDAIEKYMSSNRTYSAFKVFINNSNNKELLNRVAVKLAEEGCAEIEHFTNFVK